MSKIEVEYGVLSAMGVSPCSSPGHAQSMCEAVGTMFSGAEVVTREVSEWVPYVEAFEPQFGDMVRVDNNEGDLAVVVWAGDGRVTVAYDGGHQEYDGGYQELVGAGRLILAYRPRPTVPTKRLPQPTGGV